MTPAQVTSILFAILALFIAVPQVSAEVLGSALFEEDETNTPKSMSAEASMPSMEVQEDTADMAMIPDEQGDIAKGEAVAAAHAQDLMNGEAENEFGPRMYKGAGMEEPSVSTEEAEMIAEEPMAAEEIAEEMSPSEESVSMEEIEPSEPTEEEALAVQSAPIVPDVAPLERTSPELEETELDAEEQIPSGTPSEVVPAEQPQKSWWKFWTWWQ